MTKFKNKKNSQELIALPILETLTKSKPIYLQVLFQKNKFICSICFKELKSSSSFGKHIRNTHGEKWQCNYCKNDIQIKDYIKFVKPKKNI